MISPKLSFIVLALKLFLMMLRRKILNGQKKLLSKKLKMDSKVFFGENFKFGTICRQKLKEDVEGLNIFKNNDDDSSQN